jgi:hypothetical protein
VQFERRVRALIDDQGATDEERALIESEVHSCEPLGEGGVNTTWRVELGASHEGAFFKPINGIDRTTAHLFGHTRETSFLAEVSAYRLAFALGPPFSELVAPCVIRWLPEVDEHAPGSLSAERFDERQGDVFFLAPQLVLRAAFFDALIGNQDRSRSNLLFDAGRGELSLIDHGFSFPRDGDVRNTSILLDWRINAGIVQPSDDECAALDRLGAADDLLGLVRYLDHERCKAVINRAERILDTSCIA